MVRALAIFILILVGVASWPEGSAARVFRRRCCTCRHAEPISKAAKSTATEEKPTPPAEVQPPFQAQDSAAEAQDATQALADEIINIDAIPTVTIAELRVPANEDTTFDEQDLSPTVRQFVGRRVRIKGYVTPISTRNLVSEFLLRGDLFIPSSGDLARDDVIIATRAETLIRDSRPILVEGRLLIEELDGRGHRRISMWKLDDSVVRHVEQIAVARAANLEPRARKALRQRLGEGAVFRWENVNAEDAPEGDPLPPQAVTVGASLQYVDDADLAEVAVLIQLESLTLRGTFTDQGMSHLRPLKKLESLSLTSGLITADGIAEIAAFRGLRELDLSQTLVKGDVLRRLSGLSQMRKLVMPRGSVVDADIEHLQKMTQLEFLSLNDCEISDAGAHGIARLKALKGLWLGGTRIGDEAMGQFGHLPKLVFLDIDGCRVSQAAVQELMTRRPRLVIPGRSGSGE